MKYSIGKDGLLKHHKENKTINTNCHRDLDWSCGDHCAGFDLEDDKLALRCCQRQFFGIKIAPEYLEKLK